VLYSEDVYVGYRHYDTVGQNPLFRFGHGLSYTTFRLSELALQEPAPDAGNIKGESIGVTVSVSNTGPRAGAEVVQVYVCPPATSTVGRPVRELKGYTKVMLESGESKEVEIVVSMGLATSFWDEARSAWCSEKGTYTFEVVGTGEDNVLTSPFKVRTSRWWNGL
jgi:beta-glucosidase